MANKEKYCFFSHPETEKHYITPSHFCDITHGTVPKMIDEYIAHPEAFVRMFTVVINGKRRRIVTYQPNRKGASLRNLQRMFVCVLKGFHKPSKYSYAYKEGSSTKACLAKHMISDHFLKTDIHAYFDSVSYDLLCDKLFALIPQLKLKHSYWSKILSACFFDGKLPIGFVSSPMLSDLFLKDTDERLGSMDGINYTRYADDFILSATGDSAEDKLHDALDILNEEMVAHRLELNKKKTYFRHLRLEGDAIHVLGLNLVRTANCENRITVSDHFIRETSMELCSLLQKRDKLDDWEARKRFCAVMGKVGYITYASEQSAQKLQKMLLVKTGRNVPLDYKRLLRECMTNPITNAEYAKQQYMAAYAKAINFRPLICNGMVWERASIRAATAKEQQAISSKELNIALYNNLLAKLHKEEIVPVVDSLTTEERGESRKREYALGSLKHYIMGLCRATESAAQVCRVRLTIGDTTVTVKSNAEITALREHARKLRGTYEAVSFFARYQYANSDNGRLRKYGNVYIRDGAFRPLLGIANGASTYMDSCAIFDVQEKYWQLAGKDEKWDEQALMECNPEILQSHPHWQGTLTLDVHWPFATEESCQEQIRGLLSLLPVSMNEDNGGRTVLFAGEVLLSSENAMAMVDALQELGLAIKQADGELQINCTLYPAGALETTEELPLDIVDISVSKHGRMMLRVGKF